MLDSPSRVNDPAEGPPGFCSSSTTAGRVLRGPEGEKVEAASAVGEVTDTTASAGCGAEGDAVAGGERGGNAFWGTEAGFDFLGGIGARRAVVVEADGLRCGGLTRCSCLMLGVFFNMLASSSDFDAIRAANVADASVVWPYFNRGFENPRRGGSGATGCKNPRETAMTICTNDEDERERTSCCCGGTGIGRCGRSDVCSSSSVSPPDTSVPEESWSSLALLMIENVSGVGLTPASVIMSTTP